VGLLLGDRGAIGVELKGEHSRAATVIGATDSAQSRTFGTGAAIFRWDSFDRAAFPRRGGMLSLRSEYAFGGARFTQHVANGAVALPLTHSLTALGRATVGTSSPESALPLNYRFMLGGSYPAPLFPETQVASVGFRPQERSGAAVARLGVGAQWEARRNLFVTVRSDAGYAASRLSLDRAYDSGIALALGTLTALGPVEISVSGRPGEEGPRLEASLGYPF
jgi:hypothetical protein